MAHANLDNRESAQPQLEAQAAGTAELQLDMDKARPRIEPPDLSEKGGLRDGVPQRSDERLFMQFLAFGGCRDAGAVARHIAHSGVEGAVYEDVNDPRGVGVLALTRTPA